MAVFMKNGKIERLTAGGHEYHFLKEGPFSGPNFFVSYGGHQALAAPKNIDGEYCSQFWSVHMGYRVEETSDGLILHIHMHNKGSQKICFDRVSLILGIDTYMDHYPEWDTKVFPTLLRCEKTHFWGYFRSPDDRILGIACPQAIASWSLEYNAEFSDGGHRIHTARLDLLQARTLPQRHPMQSDMRPGEEKYWDIYLFDVSSIELLLKKCASICKAPFFDAQQLCLHSIEDDAFA
jgi:hypothetical protein